MTQQNLAHAPDGTHYDNSEVACHTNDALTRVAETGILPVIAIPSVEAAVPLADALVAGGVRAIEVTLRNPWALEAIAAIRVAHPDMAIGAGTVLAESQVAAAQAAGADFLVSPGFDPEIVRAAQEVGLPIVPGVVNPSQVTAAVKMGLKVLKFFPAEQSGGLSALTLLHGPFPDVTFVPTGGLTLANIGAYLATGRRSPTFAASALTFRSASRSPTSGSTRATPPRRRRRSRASPTSSVCRCGTDAARRSPARLSSA